MQKYSMIAELPKNQKSSLVSPSNTLNLKTFLAHGFCLLALVFEGRKGGLMWFKMSGSKSRNVSVTLLSRTHNTPKENSESGTALRKGCLAANVGHTVLAACVGFQLSAEL